MIHAWNRMRRSLKVWSIKRRLRKLENLYNDSHPEDYDCGRELLEYICPEAALANEQFIELNLRLRREFGLDYYTGEWVQP